MRKKTMGDRAFIASAPTLWNDLPLEIRMAKSVHIFKKTVIKTYLFLWPSCYFLQVRPW